MRTWLILAALIMLASCTTPQQPQPNQTTPCAWPEIVSDSGCCRDLNENGLCDTIDFKADIEQQKQQEYEESVAQSRETAEQSGKLKRTIVNDVYDAANAVTNYRFLYAGDEVTVTPERVTRKLVNDYDFGIREIAGRRQQILMNTIHLDVVNKNARGQCVPPEQLVKEGYNTPCDAIIGMTFDVPYDAFAMRLPPEWLKDFLFRTPYEIEPGSHIGKRTTTLYRFTDLKDAQHKTNLWVDDASQMPLRVEVWQDDTLVSQEHYIDLYLV